MSKQSSVPTSSFPVSIKLSASPAQRTSGAPSARPASKSLSPLPQLMRHLSVQLGFDVQTSRPDLLQAIDEELQRWESAGQSQLTRPDPFVCGVRLTPAQEARVVATRGSLGAHALAASPVLLSLPPCASPPGASFPWARGWAGRWPPFGDPGADAAWDVVAINAGEPPLMEWQVPAYEHSRGRLAGAAAGALAQRVGVDTSFLSLLSSLRAAARARHGVPQRDVAAACNGAAGVVYALVEGLLRGAARAARSPAEKERASKPTPVRPGVSFGLLQHLALFFRFSAHVGSLSRRRCRASKRPCATKGWTCSFSETPQHGPSTRRRSSPPAAPHWRAQMSNSRRTSTQSRRGAAGWQGEKTPRRECDANRPARARAGNGEAGTAGMRPAATSARRGPGGVRGAAGAQATRSPPGPRRARRC